MPLSSEVLTWEVVARSSPLSQVQVREVESELRQYYPEVKLMPTFFETIGDRDQVTSLRNLEKTDFFTKDLDEKLLDGKGRIAIHSAKDLPDPLPKGLALVALTQGKDPRDALVLRPDDSLESLKPGARVATSSLRREACIRELRHDLEFCDIRGTIGQRLAKLDSGEVDAVVIAEAALIRLGLQDRNRLLLAVETVPYQGRLAVVARADDHEAKAFFACVHAGL